MNKISVVVLTKNEEVNIKTCLNSLKGLADEVVIVDDFSEDTTVAICENYGAKVIRHHLNNKFDTQRNLGITHARGPWILQLDADEVIPKRTACAIKQVINNASQFRVYRLKRKNFFLGYPLSYAGAYEYLEKLFMKGIAFYQGDIHETLLTKVPVGNIAEDIYHYPFDSIQEVIERANFYTDLEASRFVAAQEMISFREIKYRLFWKSLKLFWKLYVRKKGYKDGVYGLMWSIVNVIGPQIKWFKIWEQALKEGKLK